MYLLITLKFANRLDFISADTSMCKQQMTRVAILETEYINLASLPIYNLNNLANRHRGYSNVFVKYVFYFTSEVDNIYIS